MTTGGQVADDLGLRVELRGEPQRIVSLVPSWTQTLFALGAGDRLVGITRFCQYPAEQVAGLVRVGGTKNPDLGTIVALEPDFVLANAEENRREDLDYLRQRGLAVFITYPKSIAGAVESILRLGGALNRRREADRLARRIVRTVSEVEAGLGMWSKLRLRAFCPVWKNPWMSFNADTYAHDVLRMLGFNNVYAAAGERYPKTTLTQALELRPQVVLLPDEPYRFDKADIVELKQALPPALARRVLLIGGRDLHWYGVHMVRGLKSLAARLARVREALV